MAEQVSTETMAKGRWKELLQAFGVPAKILSGRHQPCPFCGGKDRFRWTNYKDGGGYYCSQCGPGSGFKLLKGLFGWDFKKAANRIDGVLVGNWRISMDPASRPPVLEISPIPKSVRDCALWLRKYHPEKLDEWLNKHEIEVKWWLSTQEV